MKIEEDIPAPRRSERTHIGINFADIPVGKSAFFSGSPHGSIRAMAHRTGGKNNMKFMTALAEKDGVKGIRVWRIE